MSQDTVKIIDDFIEVRFVGDQTGAAVKEVSDQVIAASQQFIDRDEWVRVLVDLTEQGKTNTGSRKASKEAYNYGTYDKLVVIGAGKLMKHFVNTVIATSGRQSKARVMDNRDEALEWLHQNPEQLKI
jgi:hypothetical protein